MYLAKQPNDFKSGTRQDPTMKGIVMASSDITNLSAYYASL
jgi:cytochrome c553